jgi:Xaa-Pro aminopeptidase
VARGRKVHFLPPYRPENTLKLLQLLDVQPSQVATAASLELVRAVVEMRAVKSAEEIEEIEKAVNTSVDMHTTAMRMVKPGMAEMAVAAKVTEIALAAGGDLSFPVIATIHGETLHNHCHSNVLKDGQLFLLDCGAETSRRGLMKGNAKEAVAQGAHAMLFQCGLGHMLGLDVHDMEDLGEVWVGYEGQPKSTQFGLKSLRLARELRPGFVFTVEPGAYFIPQLMDRWQAEGKFTEFIDYGALARYRNFGGIRIEEDFVVTPTSCRLLGKPKAKTVAEVEALRA